jgi:signal transduction histidine kinase
VEIDKEKELKILMLEDLPEDMGLIEYFLKKGGLKFISKQVDSKSEFVEALKEFKPDVILSDHALPKFNSIDALSICKKTAIHAPFILVTGTVSEEFAVNCLKQGADDYVLKSNLTRLPTAILNSLKQRQISAKRRQAEKALRRQNEELVKINKELDSFVYSVSHKIRAPLMSVLGLVNLAKLDEGNGNGSGAFKQYFSMMESSIHRLDDTLKEILDYSRNARSNLNIEKVNMRALLEEGFERLKYIEGSDLIDKRIFVEEGQEPFYSDSYRLMVIFHNLISNSIKYRDPNKEAPFISIAIKTTHENAVIRFEDNGIGIPEEYLSKIFDMFFRATDRSEGAGLGLYIVRETVEKLNGTITVDSQANVGTVFDIIVPNCHAPEPANKVPATVMQKQP